jgi:nucleoid DNA-binding protein
VKTQQIIKEVADNLGLSYKDVNDIVRFAFSSTSKSMKDGIPKITVRYIGTFTKKLSKRERYKNYLRKKDENNRDK